MRPPILGDTRDASARVESTLSTPINASSNTIGTANSLRMSLRTVTYRTSAVTSGTRNGWRAS